jgi:predicted nucleic acid-binding protein
LVAATAVATGWRVATANGRHFERISGVQVVSPNLAQ